MVGWPLRLRGHPAVHSGGLRGEGVGTGIDRPSESVIVDSASAPSSNGAGVDTNDVDADMRPRWLDGTVPGVFAWVWTDRRSQSILASWGAHAPRISRSGEMRATSHHRHRRLVHVA